MMAAALSSSSNHHVRALPRRLIKRVGDIGQCFIELSTKQTFGENCKALFLPGGGVKAVNSIKLGELNFDFTDPNPLIVSLSSPDMQVGVVSGIPFPITDARQDVILVDKGVEIAKFSTPWVAAVMDGDTLKTTVGNTIVNVFDDKRDQFSAFISALAVNPTYTFILRGTVDVKLTISAPTPPKMPGMGGFGSFGGAADQLSKLAPSKSLTIAGIYFESEVTLSGFANFPDIEYVELLEKTINPDGSFVIKSKINIKNNSQLGVKMGNVQFNTFDAASEDPIGVTVLEQLNLAHGDNFITAVSTSTAVAKNPAEIYKRVTENGETFRFKGFAESSTNDPILAKGISVVDITVEIPALSNPAPAPAAPPAAPSA
ncbi:hypothetical protein BG015_008880 [Linnemannia schmuckeri]|uniref:Uncharacterized protein n=1 Tax=Linnemannia schmuckeri TaxID=64567 RepID=A0A9P5VAC1_9FUNG|nr:hypothetical protein BG015_008880 [Linnemannia schmuckeri]